jgi:hypothetical protein
MPLGTHFAATIGRLLPAGGRAAFVCTPAELGFSFARQVVDAHNELYCQAAVSSFFAVRIVPSNTPAIPGTPSIADPVICTSVAEGYRDRPLVWMQGDYEPLPGIMNVVAPWVAPGFPGTAGSRLTLADIAMNFCAAARDKQPDRFTPHGWHLFNDASVFILAFLRNSFEQIGNDSVDWTIAWWRAVALFFDCVAGKIEDGSPLSSTDAKWVFAAAGLPFPNNSHSEYSRLTPDIYSHIIQERFSTRDAAEETLSWLRASSTPTGLEHLPWNEFSVVLRQEGHPGSALLMLGDTSQERLHAWATTSESDFSSLLTLANQGGEIAVAMSGNSLPSISQDCVAVILPLYAGSLSFPAKGVASFSFAVVLTIPWNSGVQPPSITNVPPEIAFRPRAGWSFTSTRAQITANGLELEGSLVFECKSGGTWPTKPIVLRCESSGDLAGFINTAATTRLLLPCPWRQSVFIASGPSAKLFVGAGGKFKISNRTFSVIDEEPFELPLKAESEAVIVCYDGRPLAAGATLSADMFTVGRATATVRTGPFEGISEIPHIRLTNGMEVYSADNNLLVTVSVDEDVPHPWLPLAATACGTTPNDSVPTSEMSDRLRGHLESLWLSELRQLPNIPPASMIYCILPTTTAETIRGAPVQAGPFTRWLTPPDQGFQLDIENAGAGPDSNLYSTPEFTDLLGSLNEILSALERQGDGGRNVWPSRWQLKNLPEILVNRYLAAYSALVQRGRALNPTATFWACYPFSAIIYDPAAAKVVAVLLSPLHPLRLSWLYGAERALMEATATGDSRWRTLAQVIEGWNYPLLGPAPGYEPITLAAVPIDSGPEQLFLGWSALVTFDMTAGSQLLMPTYAGGWRMPGGSSSGLNQGGVGAAIRDFMRVYPHLPTLSLELFASTKTSRSIELDGAVMCELAKLAADEIDAVPLPHSLRILDSDNREGPLPKRDDAFQSFSNAGGVLPVFEWRSYPSSQAQEIASDLRLVEDAQARVSLARGHGQPLGATGRWPIRRFVLRESNSQTQDVLLHSHIDVTSSTWKAFTAALMAMERIPFVTMDSLRVKPASVLLGTASKARWVVTGNNLVDPAAVARLVAQGPRPAMLWEWRPPFLPRRKGNATLDFGRRPYMTIARIPQPFRQRIADLRDLDIARADTMLNFLGRRGIGLASLLAMGDNHAEGALGFFLALRIIDALQLSMETSNRKVLVVPLDAVNSLLTAIAGDDDGTSRRADLLLMVVDAPAGDNLSWQLNFLPIEIRCTGFAPSTPLNRFPQDTATQVREKIDQLAETSSCLASVISALPDASGSEANTLQRVAMMGIIETALLLRPAQSADVVDVVFEATFVRKLLDGSVLCKQAPGVLMWFQNTTNLDTLRIRPFAPGMPAVVFVDPTAFPNEFWSVAPGHLFNSMIPVFGDQCHVQPQSAQHTSGAPIPLELPNSPLVIRQEHAEVPIAHLPETPVPVPPILAIPPPPPLPVQPTSSVTQAPPPPAQRPRVYLGKSAQFAEGVWWDPLSPAGRLTNGHLVILGAAGSGKTQALRSFLYELHRAGVPSLVLDFKDDYVQPNFLDIIGANLHDATDSLPINPLALPVDNQTGKVNVVTQVYSLCGIFKAVYSLGEIQEAHLREALFHAYEQCGIIRTIRTLTPGTALPQFDSVRGILEEINDVSLNNRLAPIFDLGLFNEGALTADNLIDRSSVIRFTQLPSEEVKKAASGILLRAIYNALLKRGHQQGLRLAIVIDEAHRIANLEPVKLLVKEARAYGVGVFLSSQEARDFDDFVFSNAASLLTLKLSETSDADRVAKLLVGSSGYREISDELQGAPQFHAFFRNDHYRPYVRTEIVPFYDRTVST